ncbi:MAG: hypothetical protein NVSMB46_06410 [Candidatus Saccharimonadales bacterium]
MITRKKIAALIAGILLAVVPFSAVSASSYNGTTVAPAPDGTYPITASTGDVVTLSSIAGTTNSLSLTFASGATGSVSVTQSATRPASAPTSPAGSVNLYYDVNTTGFTDANITSAVWNFTVSKSFINGLGLAPTNIFLYHYKNGAWQQLATKQTGSTTTDYSFSATTPSLSPFAAVAVPGLSNTGFPYIVSVLGGISVIAIVGAAYFLTRKKKHIA